MAKRNIDDAAAPFTDEEQTDSPTPPEVVDIDEVTQNTPAQVSEGQRFFFGQVQVFKFPDKTTYHVQKQHSLVTDKTAIANLLEASKNPSNFIFPE